MTELKAISLGLDGTGYVEGCLRQGAGLCNRVLHLTLADGETFAPLPEGTTIGRAKAFSVGGLMSRRDTLAWLAEHIMTLWRTGATGTFLLQDIWAKSTDPAVQGSDIKKFFQASNVYYFLERGDADLYSIKRAFGAVASYLFIGFFTEFSVRSNDLSPDYTVRQDLIDEIARETREVFVGAYDQEGLVVWRRFQGAAKREFCAI